MAGFNAAGWDQEDGVNEDAPEKFSPAASLSSISDDCGMPILPASADGEEALDREKNPAAGGTSAGDAGEDSAARSDFQALRTGTRREAGMHTWIRHGALLL